MSDLPVPSPEFHSQRPLRSSSISYHHSTLRDSRDRTTSRSRVFIVVIPPPSLLHQRGHLGHTLSLGPLHRLSHGIIMPLYPTMYAQLTAIAREFNFPSVTGLCLYLHCTDNGVTVTPRISDESWHPLWSLFLDGSALSQRTLPIGGQIEFDIDVVQARWYPSWLSSSKDSSDVPGFVYPFTAPVDSHIRGNSRTTTIFDENADDKPDAPVVRSAPHRHVPRKLSLVDRFDTVSSRSGSKMALHPTPSPPLERLSIETSTLSPIAQEDEPKTARQDLNIRVQSWRASAMLESTPITLDRQTSLNPPIPSNDFHINPPSNPPSAKSLKLEEYAFSISSAGPEDFDYPSSSIAEYLPSVHIDRRLLGSVCLTPLDCTSLGPLDYEPDSSIDTIRSIHSPDVACRVIEDSPLTPLTTTSWGAPFSYPSSPSSASLSASVGLERRCLSDAPISPSTITSWGPQSYSASPVFASATTTPDIAYRQLSDMDPAIRRHSSPHLSVLNSALNEEPTVIRTLDYRNQYPYFKIYPDVYSLFDLYPGIAGQPSTRTAIDYRPVINCQAQKDLNPFDVLSIQVAPNFSSFCPQVTVILNQYPSFNLYPPLYPSFDIYPPIQRNSNPSPADKPLIILTYPTFSLYPVQYPYFNIYHMVRKPPLESSKHIPRQLTPSFLVYPVLDIYPAVYPHFNLYPTTELTLDERSKVSPWRKSCPNIRKSFMIGSQYKYPVLNIYPAVYPHFDIYPPLLHAQNRSSFTPPKPLHSQTYADEILPRVCYPIFNLYPATYPEFDLYPPISCMTASHSETSYSFEYPVICLYPSTNPYLKRHPISIAPSPGQKNRCTRVELVNHSMIVIPKSLKSSKKSHQQLHHEVFPDGQALSAFLGQQARDKTAEPLLTMKNEHQLNSLQLQHLPPHKPSSPTELRDLVIPLRSPPALKNSRRASTIITPLPLQHRISQILRRPLSEHHPDVSRQSLISDRIAKFDTPPSIVRTLPRRRDSLVLQRSRNQHLLMFNIRRHELTRKSSHPPLRPPTENIAMT
ncbi:hypothetical protein AMATHDRAFT_84287 [Amanita thiersii Skay4041]|uniref:Uncharacterized protein n=1 Tax=Amanita thiersii Skay4041 TaxID=703135 RepID=A0A2A9NXT3_9AGAR|nr:hypothetical protein AMATHDRAFT_84287 [Amanita thiersii Skay4041]